MRAVRPPGHNGPVTADPPSSGRRRLRALPPVAWALRRSGPRPRPTRRNWAFDALLVAVFIVVALSGTDITGHLFETTSDTNAVMAVPVPPGPDLPPAPRPAVEPYGGYRHDSQGPGWV